VLRRQATPGGVQDVDVKPTGRGRRSQGLLQVLAELRAAPQHVRATVLPRIGDGREHHVEGRHVGPWFGREVRAAVEGRAIRGQEDRHRPAARAGHRLHRLHVDVVEVRPLLAVDLDIHEGRVHELGGARILEGLALHDVTPVARGVANRQQDGPVLGPGTRERFLAPRIPIDGVVCVLQQVRAGLARQAVGHG
jgi:hypothetical protein